MEWLDLPIHKLIKHQLQEKRVTTCVFEKNKRGFIVELLLSADGKKVASHKLEAEYSIKLVPPYLEISACENLTKCFRSTRLIH
jgi:hypothetical protein